MGRSSRSGLRVGFGSVPGGSLASGQCVRSVWGQHQPGLARIQRHFWNHFFPVPRYLKISCWHPAVPHLWRSACSTLARGACVYSASRSAARSAMVRVRRGGFVCLRLFTLKIANGFVRWAFRRRMQLFKIMIKLTAVATCGLHRIPQRLGQFRPGIRTGRARFGRDFHERGAPHYPPEAPIISN